MFFQQDLLVFKKTSLRWRNWNLSTKLVFDIYFGNSLPCTPDACRNGWGRWIILNEEHSSCGRIFLYRVLDVWDEIEFMYIPKQTLIQSVLSTVRIWTYDWNFDPWKNTPRMCLKAWNPICLWFPCFILMDSQHLSLQLVFPGFMGPLFTPLMIFSIVYYMNVFVHDDRKTFQRTRFECEFWYQKRIERKPAINHPFAINHKLSLYIITTERHWKKYFITRYYI